MTSPVGAVEPRYADMGDQSQQSLARGLPGVWDQEPLVAVKNTFHSDRTWMPRFVNGEEKSACRRQGSKTLECDINSAWS